MTATTLRATRILEWRWSLVATVLALAFLAQYAQVGGDWEWLVAMGYYIRTTGEVPQNVPFAEAPSDGWHNVPVLAEMAASIFHDVEPRFPILVHLALIGAAFVLLAGAARRRGASDAYVAVCIALVAVGCFASLVVLRAQLWSLLGFPLLIALTCSQARRPDRRIWWAVPLLAVWGNLHGAALLGVCFLGAYLVVGRLRARTVESVAVGLASVLALGLNPQLWRTPAYYASVFDNVAAQRAEGLWSRVDIARPMDVLMLMAIVPLVFLFLRRRRAPWEYVAVIGLSLVTASAARHGVWLVFALVVLAAGSRSSRAVSSSRKPDRASSAMAVTLVLSIAVSAPIALRRGESILGAPPDLVAAVVAISHSGVVLAPAPLSESLAVAGVRLWAVNPLDAFRHEDQAAYLDFLSGSPGAWRAVEASDVVVVQEGSAPEDVVAGNADFAPQTCPCGWVCYVRRR